MTRRDAVFITAILLLMILVRVPFVPYTSGSDIAQFAGFEDTFLRHHFCFYNYVSSDNSVTEGWPYSWPYVYGPGLILTLFPLRELAKSQVIHYYDENGYHVLIPVKWIIAIKSVFIFFDILSTLLLYLILRRIGYSGKRAALVTSLYAFNPVTIYISSIYGMFDQIPLFFFLAGIYLLYFPNNNSITERLIGSFLIGISLGFKPTFLVPFFAILYDTSYYRKPVNTKILASLLIGVIVLFTPFLVACPRSLGTFIETLLSVKPTYTFPISYGFNGISNMATYIYEHVGKDTMFVITYWWIPTIILLTLELLVYDNYRDPLILSSLSYIIFMTTYWRINYQYLVPAVAFTIIILARIQGNERIKVLGLTYILLIGIWFFMFPVSWWTHVHISNPNISLWHVLDRFSLMIFDEEPYLFYSLILTLIEYLLSIEIIIHMATRKPNEST